MVAQYLVLQVSINRKSNDFMHCITIHCAEIASNCCTKETSYDHVMKINVQFYKMAQFCFPEVALKVVSVLLVSYCFVYCTTRYITAFKMQPITLQIARKSSNYCIQLQCSVSITNTVLPYAFYNVPTHLDITFNTCNTFFRK